uniref:Uncharacterized protein n=1 Tax=Anguilla anguilla TaxID=7936 RepID=A0A0E9Q6P0_ANGAN
MAAVQEPMYEQIVQFTASQ